MQVVGARKCKVVLSISWHYSTYLVNFVKHKKEETRSPACQVCKRFVYKHEYVDSSQVLKIVPGL
jgi:hypothetical protein